MKPYSVLWVICALFSVCASAWLLVTMHRLPKKVGAKLLPRQLWHLALADVVAFSLLHLGSLYSMFAPCLNWSINTAYYALCVPNLFYRVGIISSALVEAHIAIAMMATRRRWIMILHALSHRLCLKAVWAFGLAIGGASMVVTYIWDDHHITSTYHCSGGNVGSNVKNAVLIVSLVICLVVYLYLGLQWHQVTGMQQLHLINQLGLLLLANICSTGPRVAIQFCGWLHEEEVFEPQVSAFLLHFTRWFIEPLYSLGGFINWLMYFALHQRTRRILRTARTLGTPEHSVQLSQSDITSYNVGFGQTEVIHFVSTGREAQRVAGQEARNLEAEREIAEQNEFLARLADAQRNLSELASMEFFSTFDAPRLRT